MQYKLSCYNYYFSFGEDEVGIFNTFSGAVVGLTLSEFENLKRGKGDIESHVRNGILVPFFKNELDAIYANRAKHMVANEKPTYRIFTTTDCNARCFYCYEDRVAKTYMSLQTAERVCEFILGNIGDQKCLIQWFGGEPLMNPNVIDLISKKLENQAQFMMITNASLIDAIGVEQIKKWHISKIQVTLDGTKNVYNKRKGYVDIIDGFSKVIENILALIKNEIFVSIRINYDHQNVDDVLSLIAYLAKVLPTDGRNYGVYAAHLFSIVRVDDEETRKDDWFRIQNALIEHKFSTIQKSFSLQYRSSQCFACQTRSFVITADGGLYKCALSTGNVGERLGDVNSGITNYEILMSWADPSIRKECQSCVWLPVCQCGCEAGRKGYITDKCILQKDFVDEVLRIRYKRGYISSYVREDADSFVGVCEERINSNKVTIINKNIYKVLP